MAPIIAILLIWPVSAQDEAREPPRLSAEGRFLYADDDDWDWASPANANPPCRLSVYGRMPWSALDWMEDGLDEVRAVLVGTPPECGNYLTMADLNRLRGAGPKRSYEQILPREDVLSELLKEKKPPNVIILMQDIGRGQGPPITAADVEAAAAFVRRGGRLLVLDDWGYYKGFVAPLLDAERFPRLPPKVPVGIDAKVRKEVERLVALLADPNFRQREHAQAELLKLGKEIVPLLEVLGTTDAEQQTRLAAILKALRPPPSVDFAAIDPWLTGCGVSARERHATAELRTISRDGQQRPGVALLIALPSAPKGR